MKANYSVELVEPLGGTLAIVSGAKNRELTMSVDEGDTFSFQLNGDNPSAKYIREMVTDVVVYRNGDKIYTGRILSAPQSGDSTGSRIQVNSVDYKTLLKRKFCISGGAQSGDLEAIAWSLISGVQVRYPNATLGITRGGGQTTHVNVTNWPRNSGTSIKDLIDSLAATGTSTGAPSAFEWWIDPNLVFRVFKPIRGRQTPTFTCDFGGSVLSYDTSFDPNSYANRFFVHGAGNYFSSITTEYVNTAGKAGGLLGAEFEEYIFDASLASAAQVDSRLFWLASFNGRMDLCKSYNLELASDHWNGPSDLWIGDFVNLHINHGALKVNTSSLRVKNMHIQIEDSGFERVGVEVGFATPATFKDYSRMSAFMLTTRRQILRTRATWYAQLASKYRREYLAVHKRYGPSAYKTKAYKKRYQDLLRAKNTWRQQMY